MKLRRVKKGIQLLIILLITFLITIVIFSFRASDKNTVLQNFDTVFLLRTVFLITLVILLFLTQKLYSLIDKIKKEEKLQIEASLKEVYERIDEFFIALDNNWNFTYLNNKAALQFRMKTEDIIGKSLWDLTPQVANHPFRNLLIDAKSKNEKTTLEFHETNSNRWFETIVYPDKIGMTIYYKEVTEKKLSENVINLVNNEIKVLNERFFQLSNATNDAIWDWDIATNDVWGNKAYLELLKNNPNQLSNYENFISKVHPEDSKLLFDSFYKSIENKEKTIKREYRFLGTNGEWIHFLNRSFVVYDNKNNPLRVVGVMQDISKEKKIQNDILKEKYLSDTLIQNLPGIFYLFNTKGKYLRWNNNLEKISGYSNEEIAEINPMEFIPESDREQILVKIQNVFEKGYDTIEGNLITKNKKIVPFYFKGVAIDYEGEECLMGVGLDISEKTKFQKKLRELTSQNEKNVEIIRTKIAREIHDVLGQQLTGLKMNISWLNKKDYKEEEIQNKLKDSINLIDEISKQVRSIATELRPGILDDLGIIAAIEWQSEMFEKRSFLKASVSSNVSFVSISNEKGTAIFRVFQECFNNILKHAQATKVNTEILVNDYFFELKINDNGEGFNLKDIEHKKTLGILGMQERIDILQGHFEIKSVPKIGTSVLIKIPLSN
jgi:PAS domain S-box-containing protein